MEPIQRDDLKDEIETYMPPRQRRRLEEPSLHIDDPVPRFNINDEDLDLGLFLHNDPQPAVPEDFIIAPLQPLPPSDNEPELIIPPFQPLPEDEPEIDLWDIPDFLLEEEKKEPVELDFQPLEVTGPEIEEPARVEEKQVQIGTGWNRVIWKNSRTLEKIDEYKVGQQVPIQPVIQGIPKTSVYSKKCKTSVTFHKHFSGVVRIDNVHVEITMDPKARWKYGLRMCRLLLFQDRDHKNGDDWTIKTTSDDIDVTTKRNPPLYIGFRVRIAKQVKKVEVTLNGVTFHFVREEKSQP